MLLDHAPHAVEVLKFASLDYAEFKSFVHALEDVMFALRGAPGAAAPSRPKAAYTKDESTVDVEDEYYAEIDKSK